MGEDSFREIKGNEMETWKPQKQGMASSMIEEFLSSKMDMAEVNLDRLPEPSSKVDSRVKSTKQDSFSSSFYAWKKKRTTKDKLQKLGIDILLIRREERVALKKVRKKE